MSFGMHSFDVMLSLKLFPGEKAIYLVVVNYEPDLCQ